jgi:hypothetical protein
MVFFAWLLFYIPFTAVFSADSADSCCVNDWSLADGIPQWFTNDSGLGAIGFHCETKHPKHPLVVLETTKNICVLIPIEIFPTQFPLN